MTTFSWLHISDLHWGNQDQPHQWSEIQSALLEDIRKIQEKAGVPHWDVVCFTGDLVFSGTQYPEMTNKLKAFWEKLKCSGGEPVLLAVPGNHDLLRPDSNDDGCLLLKRWAEEPDVRKKLQTKKSSCSKTVSQAFKGYRTCLSGFSPHVGNQPGWEFKPGLLPGDFSAVLRRDGLSIGFVGLNSAFLQLQEGNYHGKLDLHTRQLVEVCGEDTVDWCKGHHVNFLLTHHPPDWFCAVPGQGKDFYTTFVNPPGRFSFHLCGHAHDNRLWEIAAGGGTASRWTIQAASLFGSKEFSVWHGDRRVAGKIRSHGYIAGKIVFDSGRISARLWPRVGDPKDDGAFAFDKDTTKHLQDGEGTASIHLGTYDWKIPGGGGKRESPPEQERESSFTKYLMEKIEALWRENAHTEFVTALKEIARSRKIQADDIPAHLVNTGLEAALSLVRRSLTEAYKRCGRDFSKKIESFHCARDISGWLFLGAVENSWAKKHELPVESVFTGLNLHVGLETSVAREVVFCRLYRIKAEPFLVDTSERYGDGAVKMGRSLGFNCEMIENGVTGNILEIKQCIWAGTIPEKPFPREYRAEDDEYLSTLLRADILDEIPKYLTLRIRTDDKVDVDHMGALMEELRRTLPQLNLIVLVEGKEETILTMKEKTLCALVDSVLQLNPERSDT